jgi:hypothetical protein
VYLAVYLEGASQRRADRTAAHAALLQLLGELREDVRDFDRIIAKQDSLDTDYSNLARWLASSRTPPADSVAGALYRVSTENSTLFPRRASWTTMIAGNQLGDLGAPELVLRLGQLYETIYDRTDYDSALFDQALTAATLSWAAVRWHSLDSAPLSHDEADLEHLASSLAFLHRGWNIWYRDLLVEYRGDLISTISVVEEYFASHGVPAGAP